MGEREGREGEGEKNERVSKNGPKTPNIHNRFAMQIDLFPLLSILSLSLSLSLSLKENFMFNRFLLLLQEQILDTLAKETKTDWKYFSGEGF